MNSSTSEHAAEAARLKAIYAARKKEDPTLNQERVAELCSWSGQSAVSQYMNGKIPLNLPALLKLATALSFAPEEVSPRLVHGLGLLSHIRPAQPTTAQSEASRNLVVTGSFEPWDDNTPLNPDELDLPFFKEVEASAGSGSAIMLETGGRKLRFSKRTLQAQRVSPDDAACISVSGNSMEPVLPHGSTVGVNTAETKVLDGKMYVIDHDGQLRVKLLYRLPGGGLRIRSYNSDEHPDESYTALEVQEHIRIIGKVFWYSALI